MQTRRADRTKAALIVIDLQEKLLPAISHKDPVLQNALRLIQGALVLRLPILATEQYRKGLGQTVPEVAHAIPGFSPVEKLAFSACGAAAILEALKQYSDVLLCGIEAHVCVSQTCLDLLDAGFRVFVVADAIGSRAAENCELALDRMRQAGAVIVSTEMILFELLQSAGNEDFKQILNLVK